MNIKNPWVFRQDFSIKEVCAISLDENPEQPLSYKAEEIARSIIRDMKGGTLAPEIYQEYMTPYEIAKKARDNDWDALDKSFIASPDEMRQIEEDLASKPAPVSDIRLKKEEWREWFARYGEEPMFLQPAPVQSGGIHKSIVIYGEQAGTMIDRNKIVAFYKEKRDANRSRTRADLVREMEKEFPEYSQNRLADLATQADKKDCVERVPGRPSKKKNQP